MEEQKSLAELLRQFNLEDEKIKSIMASANDHMQTLLEEKYKEEHGFLWKYDEDQILNDLKEYLKKTYGQHYKTEHQDIQCFDAWIALGDSGPTFRNTAMKYLWRYGKKGGKNKDDLMKAFHYMFMLIYVEHYKDNENELTIKSETLTGYSNTLTRAEQVRLGIPLTDKGLEEIKDDEN